MKHIKDYDQFTNQEFEVIISYDCTNKTNPYRRILHRFLVQNGAAKIGESTYLLKELMTKESIIDLENQLQSILDDCLKALNEVKQSLTHETIVDAIIPHENIFYIKRLVYYNADKK